MRKNLTMVGLSLLTLAGCGFNAPPQDVVLIKGHIITMNKDMPTAEAMVIGTGDMRGGIIAMGDLALIDQFPDIPVVDYAGKTILPGFIDSHVHVRELGMDRIKADLVGVETVEDIVVRLRARFPDPEPGEWLIGQGWDEGEFASRGYPDRTALDAAFPDNPIKLESLHGFGGFYNGAALAIAGIDANTPNLEVGDILRRADGTPTGVMLTLAQGLVNQHVPRPSVSQVEEAIVAGLKTMAAAGVTSVHEAGMTGLDVQAFENLAKNDALPIRVYGLLDGNDNDLVTNWLDRGLLNDPEDWLDIRGFKVFYDGSLGSRTALMAAPYYDAPGAARPTERISPDNLRSLAQSATQHGFQMATHAIGDEGNNRTISIYEDEAAGDHRWRVEHAQVVLPDYYARVAKAGILSSVESSHAMGDSDWAEDRLGPERIKHAYAWQKIIGAGGRLMMNSDLPGEPWTPMETLYFAVTRQKLDGTPTGGWYADQALSVDEALHAMTLENAYGAFQEDALGSLEAGKRADFVILDADPTEVAPRNIKDIQVEETWVAGTRVYSAD